MKEDAKEILRSIHDMGDNLEDCISSLQTASIYNNDVPLKDIREKINDLKKIATFMIEKVVSIARDNPPMRHYVTVPTNLLR